MRRVNSYSNGPRERPHERGRGDLCIHEQIVDMCVCVTSFLRPAPHGRNQRGPRSRGNEDLVSAAGTTHANGSGRFILAQNEVLGFFFLFE